MRIELQPPLTQDTEAQVVVSAHRDLDNWPIEDQPARFALPEVLLPQSAVVEGTYVIKADEDLDVVPLDISGLDPANIKVRGQRFGYSYQDTRFTGSLIVSRKPSRIAATTLAVTRLEQTTLFSHLEAQLDIEGGGLRTVQVALSESAGEDLRFLLYHNQARIVEQQSAAAENGERIWTLGFDRRVIGILFLAVDVK